MAILTYLNLYPTSNKSTTALLYQQMQCYTKELEVLGRWKACSNRDVCELIPVNNLFRDFNSCSANEFQRTFILLWIYSLFKIINKLVIWPYSVSRLLANHFPSHQHLMFVNQVTQLIHIFFSPQTCSGFKVATALTIMQMSIMTLLSFSAAYFRNHELVHRHSYRKPSSCFLNAN